MAVGHVNALHYMQDITVLVDLPAFPGPWIYPPLLGAGWASPLSRDSGPSEGSTRCPGSAGIISISHLPTEHQLMLQALKNRITLLVGNLMQAAGQQEVSTRAGANMETPSSQRHLRLIKQAHPYVTFSLVRRPFLQDVSSGLHTTALSVMHQERTGPGERVALADRHHWWLPSAHQPQVRSGERWTSTVSGPHQRWWQSGSQPLLPVPEVLGP